PGVRIPHTPPHYEVMLLIHNNNYSSKPQIPINLPIGGASFPLFSECLTQLRFVLASLCEKHACRGRAICSTPPISVDSFRLTPSLFSPPPFASCSAVPRCLS